VVWGGGFLASSNIFRGFAVRARNLPASGDVEGQAAYIQAMSDLLDNLPDTPFHNTTRGSWLPSSTIPLGLGQSRRGIIRRRPFRRLFMFALRSGSSISWSGWVCVSALSLRSFIPFGITGLMGSMNRSRRGALCLRRWMTALGIVFFRLRGRGYLVTGDKNPEDDAGHFVVDTVKLRGLRLSRMGMEDLGA
jgi:hypothetical protein